MDRINPPPPVQLHKHPDGWFYIVEEDGFGSDVQVLSEQFTTRQDAMNFVRDNYPEGTFIHHQELHGEDEMP